MTDRKVTRITADEAVKALTEAAWTHTPGLEDAAGRLLAAVEAVRALCYSPDGKPLGPTWNVTSADVREALEKALGSKPLPRERTVIHSFSGGFGADWDLHKAIELARSADGIAWITGGISLGHELAVKKGGEVYRFEARKPGGDGDA